MSNNATITIRGNVGRDPELRFLPSGDAVCNFSVAVSERVKKGDAWEETDPSWYRVTVFGREAEAVAEHLRGGQPVIVCGTQTLEKFTDKQGLERQTAAIRAEWRGVGIVPRIEAIGGRSEEREDPW